MTLISWIMPQRALLFSFFPQVLCLNLNKTSVRVNLLTEEMVADHWECNIQTVNNCAHPKSTPATFRIFPSKPRGGYNEPAVFFLAKYFHCDAQLECCVAQLS